MRLRASSHRKHSQAGGQCVQQARVAPWDCKEPWDPCVGEPQTRVVALQAWPSAAVALQQEAPRCRRVEMAADPAGAQGSPGRPFQAPVANRVQGRSQLQAQARDLPPPSSHALTPQRPTWVPRLFPTRTPLPWSRRPTPLGPFPALSLPLAAWPSTPSVPLTPWEAPPMPSSHMSMRGSE